MSYYAEHPREHYYDREDHPYTSGARRAGDRQAKRTVSGDSVRKGRVAHRAHRSPPKRACAS